MVLGPEPAPCTLASELGEGLKFTYLMAGAARELSDPMAGFARALRFQAERTGSGELWSLA